MRNERLFSKLKGIDIVAIPSSDRNFAYYTGLEGPFEGSMCFVEEKKTTVFTTLLDKTAAEESDCEVRAFTSGIERRNALEKMLRAKTVGYSAHALSAFLFQEIAKLCIMKECSKELAMTRAVKDRKEILLMKQAVSVTNAALDEAERKLRKGVTEMQVAQAIDAHFVSACCKPAFNTIVAFDANAAVPHHASGHARLKELALLDCGALRRGYCGDLTRTTGLSKNKEHAEAIEVVREAQNAALKAARKGVVARNVDAAARSIIEESRFKGTFIHSVGHSLGMEVHDGLSLSSRSDWVLEEGMAFTIEPGVYLSGKFGVRLEIDAVVENGKAKPL